MEKPELKIFNHPRPIKSTLPPLPKKRKTDHKIEEINFDFDARADYLTGFQKRKAARAKLAKAEAAKKEREEKIVMRRQLREERKNELEAHVHAVNAILQETKLPGEEGYEEEGEVEWGGIVDEGEELIDHEEEYVDEDKYTTVTVEAVDVSKEGLQRVADEESEDTSETEVRPVVREEEKGKKVWPKKPRKQKFRYESKAERKVTRGKQKAGNKAKADARRGND